MNDTVDETDLSPPPVSAESFRTFCSFITKELGIKMSEAKLPMLQSRLQRRLRMLQLGSLDDYCAYLFNTKKGEAELVNFIDAVTTNKTDFFREPQHFAYLTNSILPSLDPEAGQSTPRPWSFKLWCAGCSSGEEPYTLAMVLAEYGEMRPDFDFSIFATDISSRVLAHATAAIYNEERIEPVADELRIRYLLRSKSTERRQVRLIPGIRAKVTFQKLNFMDEDYCIREPFDVVFFRNVMIYYAKPTQESVIGKICRHLKPGGFLFVGHSESLAGLRIPVAQVAPAIYRRLD